MNRFVWLLRREWMQHHRGWLILAVAPAIVVLLGLPFGTVQLDEVVSSPMLAAMGASIYLMALLALALTAMLFQAPGLARRDQQDRSIEFWLSLPTGHVESVSATLLMHLLLMPALVLVISALFAQGAAALLVVKVLGMPALSQISPAAWLNFNALMLLRQALGLVFCALWLSPLILLAMAASAWLKGWGVPALVAAIAVLGLLLQQLTGQMMVWQLLATWWQQAKVALLPLTRGEIPFAALATNDEALPWLSNWMLHDIGRLLRDALHPSFAGALLLAACGFSLLVWKRSRGS